MFFLTKIVDCDIESGETMKAAGLKDIDTVVLSTAVLIKSKKPSNQELVDLIASRIRGVISMFLSNGDPFPFLLFPLMSTFGESSLVQPTNPSYQPPKNMSSANTMFRGLSSKRPRKSHPASEHLPSQRLKIQIGWPLARWSRRRKSRM